MEQLITNLGFPITMAILLAVYLRELMNTIIEQIKSDNNSDRDLLLRTIEYNRKVNQELLDTNKLLAQDLSSKIDKIDNKIDNLTSDIEREE